MSAAEAVLTVDLDALAANYAILVDKARGAEVAPVVKADAYGLGLGPVARRLWAEGARSFFVARVSEGVLLRQALGHDRLASLYVLDGCPEGAEVDLHASALRPALNSLAQVESWASFARAAGRVQPCALHVDTGLNRLGLRPEEARALAASDRLKGLDVELVMSHFACADRPDDPLNALQAHRFAPVAALFAPARAALANSAGLFGDPAWTMDLVRTGIALYGGGPLARPDPRFLPVATLTAPVLQVRTVRPGETVGYDATFTARASLRVALVAAGYADGVLRASSPGGYGWLRGAPRPFLGRISMDLIALDVSDCEARPGDLVELLGPNRLLDEVAAEAGTIAYEVLTRIGSRARRRYIGEAA